MGKTDAFSNRLTFYEYIGSTVGLCPLQTLPTDAIRECKTADNKQTIYISLASIVRFIEIAFLSKIM